MFVVQAGHQNINANCDPLLHGGTGAPGEIDWTPRVADAVVQLLIRNGVDARHVDANFNCASDVGSNFDGVLAIHYNSDPPDESGYFIGVGDPNVDGNAAGSAALMNSLRTAYQAATHLELRQNWDSPNISGYYLFRSLSPATPFALAECGTGAPGAPDHDFLWNNIDIVALGLANGVLLFMGKQVITPPPSPPSPPEPPPSPEPPPPDTTFDDDLIEAARATRDAIDAFLAKHGG